MSHATTTVPTAERSLKPPSAYPAPAHDHSSQYLPGREKSLPIPIKEYITHSNGVHDFNIMKSILTTLDFDFEFSTIPARALQEATVEVEKDAALLKFSIEGVAHLESQQHWHIAGFITSSSYLKRHFDFWVIKLVLTKIQPQYMITTSPYLRRQ